MLGKIRVNLPPMKGKFNRTVKNFEKLTKQVVFRTAPDCFFRSKDEAKYRKVFRKT